MSDAPYTYRELQVPDNADGLRLDRFLALRFRNRSRSELVRAIKAGQVTDPTGRVLRAAYTVRAKEMLHLFIPEIAPAEAPPPFPEVLYEDDRVVVVNKPPGLMAHPAGTRFVYALVSLARSHWPDDHMDLVHRLDKDTSGVLVMTKDVEANRFLKARMKEGDCRKEYVAITKGVPDWDHRLIDAPIGDQGGLIRIQRGVVPDGLPSRTEVDVLARNPEAGLAMVRCRLHTGRTHQIRVHLHHEGFPLLGDLMYGVPPEMFLHCVDHGIDTTFYETTGAERQALHAARIVFPHPDGTERDVHAPLPPDMTSWWEHPERLPWKHGPGKGG